MKTNEKKFLRSVIAYVEWALDDDANFKAVLVTLDHDVSGLIGYGCDLAKSEKDCFYPRIFSCLSRTPDALATMRYIQKRMRACGMRAKDKSCDATARVVSIAERAMRDKSHEMHFDRAGDVWFANLKRE